MLPLLISSSILVSFLDFGHWFWNRDEVADKEVVAKRLFELEPKNSGSYVLLSSIYAAADQWQDFAIVRDKMQERGCRKIPGRSWISHYR